MPTLTLRLKLSRFWHTIYICTVKTIILAPWLMKG